MRMLTHTSQCTHVCTHARTRVNTRARPRPPSPVLHHPHRPVQPHSAPPRPAPQYVFLRVIVSIIALICEATGAYDEGYWWPDKFYVWSSVIINISQMYALYCLALFYVELRNELKPLKPIYKFVVIKAIV